MGLAGPIAFRPVEKQHIVTGTCGGWSKAVSESKRKIRKKRPGSHTLQSQTVSTGSQLLKLLPPASGGKWEPRLWGPAPISEAVIKATWGSRGFMCAHSSRLPFIRCREVKASRT